MVTLSVITICFNNKADLVATCQSVDAQQSPPDEHLVIDGSTNGEIREWLLQNPQPSYRTSIHERDKGISDAFNKGIVNAKGIITHLLNSGDVYYSNEAIAIVRKAFETDPDLMWLHSCYVQNRGNTDVVSGVPFDAHQLWKGMRAVAHPSMFIKKEVYDRHGLYNTDFKIAMDYDFVVRMRNEKNRFIEKPLVYFAPGGASSAHFFKGLSEVRKSYQSQIGSSFKMSLWQFRQKMLYYFMQTSIGVAWFKIKNKRNRV